MDDIILGAPSCMGLQDLTDKCLSILKYNFWVASEKIQKVEPFKILGSILSLDAVSPIKLQLQIKNAYALPQLQKLLSKNNWMRSCIFIATEDPTPLFDFLKGNDLSTPIVLTSDLIQPLNKIQQAIDSATLK